VRQSLLKGEKSQPVRLHRPAAPDGGGDGGPDRRGRGRCSRAALVVDTLDREGYTLADPRPPRRAMSTLSTCCSSAMPSRRHRRAKGVTALMVAARLGHAEIVRLLLDKKGRSQHARLHHRRTALNLRSAGQPPEHRGDAAQGPAATNDGPRMTGRK